MRARLIHAYIGLIAGLVTGIIPAGIMLFAGAWAWSLYFLVGFMLGEALIGFLLPKKAADFFVDLFLGMAENTHL